MKILAIVLGVITGIPLCYFGWPIVKSMLDFFKSDAEKTVEETHWEYGTSPFEKFLSVLMRYGAFMYCAYMLWASILGVE